MNSPNLIRTKYLALTALLLTAAVILSIVEGMLPSLSVVAPGVRLGLSNIPVMYALFFLEKKQAFTVAVLKSGFVFLTRGATAGILSFCGGMLSIAVMIVLMRFNKKASYTAISISGAVAHNMGQLAVSSIIYIGFNMIFYLPPLAAAGVAAGALTATVLRCAMPALERMNKLKWVAPIPQSGRRK